MNKNESTTLSIARFVMMLSVIFFHAQTCLYTYSDLTVSHGYQIIIKFFGLQFGELGVPTFFAISGYLYFHGYNQSKECYLQKIKRRYHSLLIPFIFWNAFYLATYYIVEFIPIVRQLFNEGRGLVQDYTLTDYIRAFWAEERTSFPILPQLWFVRNLMVLIILSPIIYYLLKRMRTVLMILLGIIWFFGAKWSFLVNSVFFFCFGSWFSINGKSLIKEINRYRIYIVYVFFLFLITDLLFMYYPISQWLHRIEIMLGAPFCLTIISWLVEKGYVQDVKFLTASSFFCFVTHDPLIKFIRKFSLKFIDYNSDWQMIVGYLGSIALDLAIIYFAYWILSKLAPRFLHWASGGR